MRVTDDISQPCSTSYYTCGIHVGILNKRLAHQACFQRLYVSHYDHWKVRLVVLGLTGTVQAYEVKAINITVKLTTASGLAHTALSGLVTFAMPLSCLPFYRALMPLTNRQVFASEEFLLWKFFHFCCLLAVNRHNVWKAELSFLIFSFFLSHKTSRQWHRNRNAWQANRAKGQSVFSNGRDQGTRYL